MVAAARMAVAVTEPGATTFVVLVSNDMVAVFANVCGTVVSGSWFSAGVWIRDFLYGLSAS